MMPADPEAVAVAARVRVVLALNAVRWSPGLPTTIHELGAVMGANLSALRAILAGRRGPPASWGRARGRVTLAGLAAALRCDVDALASDEPLRLALSEVGPVDP